MFVCERPFKQGARFTLYSDFSRRGCCIRGGFFLAKLVQICRQKYRPKTVKGAAIFN